MPKSHRTHFLTPLAVLLAIAALAAITAPLASASISDSEELTRFGSGGSGVATDPTTGHVYTVDANNRVSEFTPWGNFVKAFGWDVAPGAVNEQQEVRVRAASGQFNLSFGGSPTPDLPFNAPGAESEGPGSVEAALNALPTIGGAGASVSVEAVPGNPNGETPFIYTIAFKGSLAATDVDQIVASEGATPLAGGDPSSTLEARTLADGTSGGAGLESCTAESGCKVGLEGGGVGELREARGIAVDAAGDIYLKEIGNFRVQKFDSAGRFILMFGGEVNKTKVEALAPEAEQNRCTAASGDECVTGVSGTGNGQFGDGPNMGIASGPPGQIFVADDERFQRFNLQGEFEAAIPVPSMPQIYNLAFDPISGNLYAVNGNIAVRKLDSSTGAELGHLVGTNVVATDSAGNVFAKESNQKNDNAHLVLEYGPDGKPLSPASCCEAELLPPPNPNHQFFSLGALATNAVGTLYVAYSGFPSGFIRSFGPGPTMFEAPPKVPPSIDAQYAKSVERNGAVLGADINPHFFTDTRYYLQYGTGKCSEGGCEATKPLPPGALLGSKPIDRSLQSAGIFLEGLKSNTTYHYRFVAVSTGGGPVSGIGGTVGTDGEESSFTTYPAKAPLKADCQNQQFRTGFSAPLADCRAFEMVSPIDKNNGDIVIPTAESFVDQSSTDGDKFTYASYRAFANPESAPNVNQYLASRQAGVGWASEALAPAHGPATHQGDLGGAIGSLSSEFKAFSPDLCQGWLVFAAEAPMAPPSTENQYNVFKRDNCGPLDYSAMIGVELQIEGGEPFFPELQGTSADGAAAIFQAKGALSPEASKSAYQAYYASEGALHLVCILPTGVPSAGNCSGGTSAGGTDADGTGGPSIDRLASLSHAISADGNRVYWTATLPDAGGAGKVYLRENPGQEQSALSGGQCTEAEKACTLKVSETASVKAARFLAASPDGSKALFEIIEGPSAGNLYEYDREAEASTLIAKKVGLPPATGSPFNAGLVGTSEDLSRIYLVSTEALAAGATAGKENLYLSEEGTMSFIAALSSADVAFDLPSNIAPRPRFHAARVSPDGRHLAFISTERLSGYDNTDQASGRPDSEVYLYEAGGPAPLCVSCNPSGARPQGRIVQGPNFSASSLPTAATLPLPRTQLYSSHPFSDDGRRLFFESYDTLLPRDTNGKRDVYEWEAAAGPKACEAAGADVYVPSSQGCLSLISSGESPSDSEFLDASNGGRDVFFTTNSSLLPQDPGLVDVYDAREGGGLPPPPPAPEPCQGDACQNAGPPPNDPTPASASFKGAGNRKPTPRCRKGRVARKGRCVAKKHKRAARKHAAKRANDNRRPSR
jgi:hypothetical protein